MILYECFLRFPFKIQTLDIAFIHHNMRIKLSPDALAGADLVARVGNSDMRACSEASSLRSSSALRRASPVETTVAFVICTYQQAFWQKEVYAVK